MKKILVFALLFFFAYPVFAFGDEITIGSFNIE